MIDLAGAEQGQGIDHANLARHRDFRCAGVARGGEQRVAGQRRIRGVQNDRLAALRVSARGGGVHQRGRSACRQFLHHFQRDHLAGNLGEAFHPAAYVQETFGVDLDDIAGAVPARAQFRSRRLQIARLFKAVITAHHVRAFDMQHAAVIYAGYGNQLRLKSRQ